MPIGRYLGDGRSRGKAVRIILDFKQVLRLQTGQGVRRSIIEDHKLPGGRAVEELRLGVA
jgi:hypothetical protein